MDWIPDVVNFVQNVGLPGFLVVGGGIWFSKSGFPALVSLAERYADALIAVAKAQESMARALESMSNSLDDQQRPQLRQVDRLNPPP